MPQETFMLRYSIADEMLYGTVGGESISTKAFSGGGRGSNAGAERTDLAHWSTRKKAPEHFDIEKRGGPLPVGLYAATYIGKYKKFGECARLNQTLTSLLQEDPTAPLGVKVTDRDGFLIHGEGPKGSDGCIVPANKEALKSILGAIKREGCPVLLEVHSEGMRFDKLEGRKSSGNAA